MSRKPSERSGRDQTPNVPISDRPEGAELVVQAAPRSGVNQVGPLEENACRVRVTAAAVDGAANEAIVKVLAEAVRIPKSRIRVVAGQCARRKRVLFEGVTADELRSRLGRTVPSSSRSGSRSS